MLDDVDEALKVIVVGDGNVGKTSMLRRFCKNDFTEQYKKTIGAEYLEKEVFVQASNSTVKLMLWDTAGQEVFNSITAGYYRGSAAAVLAFSTTDIDSFHNVAKWKKKVEDQCGKIVMIMCQTKTDLVDEYASAGKQHVSLAEGQKMATQLDINYFAISTKTNYNVTPMFESVAARCIGAKPDETAAPAAASPSEKKEKKDKKDKSDKKDKKDKDDDVKNAEDDASAQHLKVDMKNPPPPAAKGAKKKSGGGGCAAL